jgi:hypothetical protein
MITSNKCEECGHHAACAYKAEYLTACNAIRETMRGLHGRIVDHVADVRILCGYALAPKHAKTAAKQAGEVKHNV